MKDQLPPDENSIRAGLEEAVSLADRTIEGIRRLAQDLRPPALDSAGLNEALEGLCGDFSRRTQIHIDYAGFDLSSLSPAAISLYRFLQEALTNAARHGHATRIHVLLQAHAARVFLTVEDDGQGFDPQAVLAIHPQPIGMGLIGMQERLQMVGGKLEVHSEPGHGAKLIAQVPLEQL